MIIHFHKHFEKKYQKLRIHEQKRFKERVVLFLNDPFDPILNNHALQGIYAGYRSISIAGNLRAIYKRETSDMIIFIAIGSHAKLYR